MIETKQDQATVQQLGGQDVEGLRETWRRMAGDCFMQSPDWRLNSWFDYHQEQRGVRDRELTMLAVRSATGEPLGISAWYRQSKWGLPWWKLPGGGQVCSDHTRIACRDDECELVGRKLAEWFVVESRKNWDLATPIEIEGHRDDSPEWEAFFQTLLDNGWYRDTVAIEGAWRMELPSSWNEYLNQLHYSRRRKAKKATKLLDQKNVQHHVTRDEEGVRFWWPEFVRLHQLRRTQVGDPGCFADPRFERFLKRAVLGFASFDQAWFSVVTFDERPLAILLMFDSGQTTSMYQSGIDTERLNLEPGHIVNAATIRHAINDGKRAFDFLRGDEPYKAGWLAQRVPLYRTYLFPPGAAGWGMTTALWLRRRFKRNVGPQTIDQHTHPLKTEAQDDHEP
jgi:hypothetical protein